MGDFPFISCIRDTSTTDRVDLLREKGIVLWSGDWRAFRSDIGFGQTTIDDEILFNVSLLLKTQSKPRIRTWPLTKLASSLAKNNTA